MSRVSTRSFTDGGVTSESPRAYTSTPHQPPQVPQRGPFCLLPGS